MEPSEFAKNLKEYKKAIEEEFQIAADNDVEPEKLAELSRKLFITSLPKLAHHVVWLMENAENHSTQLSAAKFIYEAIFSKAKDSELDPLNRLYNELLANDPKS